MAFEASPLLGASAPAWRLRRLRKPARNRLFFACVGQNQPSWHGHARGSSIRQPELHRPWMESGFSSNSHEKFMVVSYNILGDGNASKHRDLYSNVPSYLMKWEKRKELICQELLHLAPEIVCLQEVDHYYDLLSNLKGEGYVGNFKRRTGGAIDGCALFWKDNLFRLLEEESIQFNKFGLRDNVAQLFVFEMAKADSRRIVVGNIHVLFNPKRGDIKLGQIGLLLRKAQAFSGKWDNAPIILAGDFNSTPQSAIYKFLSSSKLNLKMHDRTTLSGQETNRAAQSFGLNRQLRQPSILRNRLLRYRWTEEELLIASGNSKCTQLEHPLKLQSSYASVKGKFGTRDQNGEPLATTYHSKFVGTVDYLWYSDGLTVQRVLDTLPMDILRRTGCLPNEQIGSDHLALACEFAFTAKCGKEHPRQKGSTL